MSIVLGLFLLASLAIPLVLWLAISQETSDPTVVDRAEAERIAKERGGHDPTRSADGPNRSVATDDTTAAGWDDHRENDQQTDRTAGIDQDDHDEWGNRRT
ncbi:hypothetical protein [Natrinema sp. SYSU A 869]|uniref:hypothetical protein n=1 Tax=Natrinema sp. SYSU A 869 TaxID=2871694 RepID=UPI001CA469EF|nr:hypothetical protein [Natrinema sp. SYSU A 869]